MIVEISSDKRFASSLDYLQKRLEKAAKYSVTSKVVSSERFVLKCDIEVGVSAVLVDAIAEVVITDLKTHFIESRLRLPI